MLAGLCVYLNPALALRICFSPLLLLSRGVRFSAFSSGCLCCCLWVPRFSGHPVVSPSMPTCLPPGSSWLTSLSGPLRGLCVGCPAAYHGILPGLPGLFCLSCCDCPRLPFPSLPNQLYHRSSLVHFSLDQGLNLPLFFSSLLLFGTVPSFPSSSLSSLHLVYPFCSLSFLLYKGFCSSFPTFLPTITSMPRPLLPSISEHP